MTAGPQRYHHGDLRRAVMDAALEVVADQGAAALSLRDLARRAGVSHAAPAHHFGDKTGLLTAIAAEGYSLLAEALRRTMEGTGSFLEVGVAYVGFAATHRAHFDVMFRPDLLRVDDPALLAARAAAAETLYGPAADVTATAGKDARYAGVAAWALVHGLATLWLNGNIPADLEDDPERLARTVAGLLYGGAPRGRRRRG